MLELAFDRLNLDVIGVTHHPENEKSRRVIEKYVNRFGGHKEDQIRNDIIIDDEPRDSVRYGITIDEWKQNRQR